MSLLSGAGQGSSNSPDPKAQSVCLLVQDLLKLECFDAVFCSTLEKRTSYGRGFPCRASECGTHSVGKPPRGGVFLEFSCGVLSTSSL